MRIIIQMSSELACERIINIEIIKEIISLGEQNSL